jgi:4-hydroxybenzoate polyprenyltransferase
MTAHTAKAATRAPGLPSLLFDLSRGQQALLSMAQPGLAAVLALHGLPALRTTVIGLVAAWSGFFAVFSLNDVLDREVDARSLRAGKDDVEGYDIDTTFLRHPLARGDLTLTVAGAWVLALGIIAAGAAFVLSPLCLACFAGAVGLEVAYCGLRSVTWLKTIVSGLMVGLGGLAGWTAVAPLRWPALAVFVFLALWEIGGRNLANDLADLESDARVGIRTVATTFGCPAAATATAVVAAATLVATAALPLPLAAVLLALALGGWSLGRPAVQILRRPTSAQAASYFNHASLYPALVLAAELLVLAVRGT